MGGTGAGVRTTTLVFPRKGRFTAKLWRYRPESKARGMPKKPMTLLEAADELGVHYMTIYRYVRTGKLPATRVGGGWRVDPDDLARMKPVSPRRPRKPAARTAVTKQLEARLLAGDEPGAWGVLEIRPCLSPLPFPGTPPSGGTGPRVHRGPLARRRAHRGRRASGQCGGGAAHLAYRRQIRPPWAEAGQRDHHHAAGRAALAPVAIAADLLRWAGFDVIELGADTPADALAQAAAGVPICWPSPWPARPRARPPRPAASSPI